jgi:hypothetical protein
MKCEEVEEAENYCIDSIKHCMAVESSQRRLIWFS